MKVRNLVVLFVKRSPHYFVQFRSLKKHFFHKSFGLTIETIEAVFCQLFGQLLDHLAPFRKVKIHSCIFILVSRTPNYNIPLHPLPSPPQKKYTSKSIIFVSASNGSFATKCWQTAKSCTIPDICFKL